MNTDEHMDAAQIIQDYFCEVIDRTNNVSSLSELSVNDQIIFVIVATRCEMDINGFVSIWEQLLNEEESQFLIDTLKKLNEPKLANCFDRCHQLVKQEGFFQNPCEKIYNKIEKNLRIIEEEIREEDALWTLDTKLSKFVAD